MLTAAVLFLALCILFILDRWPMIGMVLAGLLVLVWLLELKSRKFKKRALELEEKLVKLSAKITNLETGMAHAARPVEPAAVKSTAEESATEEKTTQEQAKQDAAPVSHPVKVETPAPEKTEVISAARKVEDPAIKQASTVARQESEAAGEKPPVVPGDSGASSSDTSRPEPVTTAPVTPARPVEPNKPTLIDMALKSAWDWFTDGNVFVRVGIIILFMGMTFLIRYAIGENLVPIELRLAAVSAAAIGLLFWGWRQRDKRRTFSLVVQGGGIGLLYLTIFAGFSLYHVIPSALAFILLALTVVLAAMLAIYQDAKPLALFATVGGFLAPVLTSSGSNNYIGLFSYYTVLNLGIFSIAWFKSWRMLNFVGFLFTFAISTIWGALSYQEENFSTTEPFLIVFFLMYVGIGILFARNRTEFYKDYVDSSLIFGTPLLAFGLQCAMVNNYEYGIAISSFTLAAFYIVLANFLWKKYGDSLRLLSETFLSLGVIFATLAIPFAIDGTLTGATWAIEGAGILWISIIQKQKYRRLFGAALIFASGVILASELVLPLSVSHEVFEYAFANSVFIGCVIIAIAASAGSLLLSREYDGKLNIENTISPALLVYGLFALFAGFEYQIYDFSLYHLHGTLLAVLSGSCALIYTVSGDKYNWDRARWVSLVSIAPISIAAVLCYAYQPQLSINYGYVIWPLSLLAYFYGLRRALATIPNKPLIIAHILAAAIIIGLLFWDGLWQLLLCYSVLAVVFNQLSNKQDWPQLKLLALGFLPVLVLCSAGAVAIDGNLIDLSSIAADVTWPFPPGYLLWPFGFMVYFYLLRQNPRIGEFSTSNMHYAGAALIYALLLWLGSWPLLLGASLLSVLYCVLWKHYSWKEMHLTSLALLPIMLLITFISLLDNSFHSFYLKDYNLNMEASVELGLLLWPLAFASLFWIYRQYDNKEQSAPSVLQSLSILLPVLLLTWEASWHLLDYVGFMNAWHLAWLPIMTLLAIVAIMKLEHWPFSMHRESYNRLALPVLSIVIVGWSFVQLTSSGHSMPLPWVPLLNPVDIVQAIAIIGFLLWSEKMLSALKYPPTKQQVNNALLGYVFLWMNVELLRVVHHWAAIPWQLPDILSADISQTVLSLFWALCGLLVTLYSSRRKKRTLWLFGAILLGVVVLKLFLIDLSARETIERIVSFTGVGLLLMLVGYFSPLPPRKSVETSGV